MAAVQVSVSGVVVMICCGLRCLPSSKISVDCFGYGTWGTCECIGLFLLMFSIILIEHCLAEPLVLD